jgi:glycosyltransferase involved in cell wall biosynthesis
MVSPVGVAGTAAAWAADAAALARLARRRNAALVHSNTSVVLGGAPAARLAGIPHVWHVREIYAAFGRGFAVYRRLLERAAALPCVSDAVRAQFGPAAPALTVHDGLAIDPTRAPRAAARAALGLPEAAFVVALLGRIASWKGQDVLMRALAALPEDGVALIAGAPWPGDEAQLERLRGLAASLGVGGRVRFAGVLEDPGLVFGAADVVAVPSTLPDPFPNSALEAAAAGCCVVGAGHGGLVEMLRDGETGLLVAPGDPAALAAVLRALRDDPGRREALGAAAAADVRARFSRAQMLAAIQALYDRLLAAA